ncbi:hypothetical protein [Streptomyces vietnamensis]|uniref:Uncharacterized protein n=1 Tax=Streptomyces vietnamensis TaxID=362257 RepID=A0A0B5I7Y7_9ACTN|nr:hypothetical protein [Streptomyces vietnamensis]AJF65733.1 hypothetical protein SVTN_16340 [Streptomyces vietnamensis]
MNSSLQDLIINLSSAAIAFTAGWSFDKARNLWRFRNIRGFWKRFATEDLKVVTSIFINEEHYIWERSGLVGVGDVLALNELRQQLKQAGVDQLPLTPSHQLTGLERQGNLILVGGPHSNQVTAEVMQRLPVTFAFGPGDAHDANIYDSVTGDVMQCVMDAGDQLVVDQGILIRATNPFNRKRSVVILAGSFGFGTSAAARLLARSDILTHAIVDQGHPFEAVFSVEVAGGAPQHIELKKLRQLDTTMLPVGP